MLANLDSHLRTRKDSIFGALSTDIASDVVVQELLSTVPEDIAVSSVVISPSTSVDTTASEGTVQVSVIATSDSLDAGKRWRDELRLRRMFEAAPPAVTQKDGTVTVGLSVSVEEVQSELGIAEELLEAVEVGPATEAADSDELSTLPAENTNEET